MTDTKAITEHWAHVADQWIEWAGRPGHDAFWKYREGLAAYLGHGSGHVLEIGCGEGRVSRELKALGYDVTASDAVPAMLDAARRANSAHRYALADAAVLPFDPASFDIVMAYNVLMDLDDMAAALREARRVLKPGGLLFVSLVHPFRGAAARRAVRARRHVFRQRAFRRRGNARRAVDALRGLVVAAAGLHGRAGGRRLRDRVAARAAA